MTYRAAGLTHTQPTSHGHQIQPSPPLVSGANGGYIKSGASSTQPYTAAEQYLERGTARWLSHHEIVDRVIMAIDSDESDSVIGDRVVTV